jgi:UDP-N-acetyl-D-mannosaminuronic acid dehydrogenase
LKFDVGIIGLGYVGLTLAAALAKSGMKVVGIEKNNDIVSKVNSGIAHFTEVGLNPIIKDQIKKNNLIARNKFESSDNCNYFIITVGTPLNEDGMPRVDMIKKAVSEVINQMTDGSTIILRSTVEVGTTRNYVEKELNKTNKKYYLAMCPERTLEGNAIKELNVLPQIIGSDDVEASESAAKLFKKITNSIIYVDKYETAEIIKLVDNSYRDVQFAFANEVARACESANVNALDVINSGKQNYPRTNVALPGLVGGPCLEKDPHIFRHSFSKFGIDLEITKAARLVNERQPSEVVSNLYNNYFLKLNSKNRLKISLLGMAFKGKPLTDDLRGSMATEVLKEIQKKFINAEIGLYDPIISIDNLKKNYPDCNIFKNIDDAAQGTDLLLITNNNEFFSYQNLDYLISLLSSNGIVFDFWNNFSADPVAVSNKKYLSLGNTKFLKNE